MTQNIKGNPKAAYSKNLIVNALYALLKEKPIQEISITEIANTAGISRLTFYRNYECKEHVIFEYGKSIKNKFWNNLSAIEKSDLPFLLECCFSIRETELERCKPVYRDSMLYSVFQRNWNATLEESPFLSHLTYSRKRILCGGMYSLLVDLTEGNNKFNKKEAVTAIMDLIGEAGGRFSCFCDASHDEKHTI